MEHKEQSIVPQAPRLMKFARIESIRELTFEEASEMLWVEGEANPSLAESVRSDIKVETGDTMEFLAVDMGVPESEQFAVTPQSAEVARKLLRDVSTEDGSYFSLFVIQEPSGMLFPVVGLQDPFDNPDEDAFLVAFAVNPNNEQMVQMLELSPKMARVNPVTGRPIYTDEEAEVN
jgi:hypothetical protein